MRGQGSALVYMVRIPDSHSGGPGSIPGCGTFFTKTTPYQHITTTTDLLFINIVLTISSYSDGRRPRTSVYGGTSYYCRIQSFY